MKTTSQNQKSELPNRADQQLSTGSTAQFAETATETVLPGFAELVKPFKFQATPHEYKVTPLRECPTPEALQHCETPDKAADYWRMHIASHLYYKIVVSYCYQWLWF